MKLKRIAVSVGETIPTGRFASVRLGITLEAELEEFDSPRIVKECLWNAAKSEIRKQKEMFKYEK